MCEDHSVEIRVPLLQTRLRDDYEAQLSGLQQVLPAVYLVEVESSSADEPAVRSGEVVERLLHLSTLDRIVRSVQLGPGLLKHTHPQLARQSHRAPEDVLRVLLPRHRHEIIQVQRFPASSEQERAGEDALLAHLLGEKQIPDSLRSFRQCR